MLSFRLYFLQRITALIMMPLVIGHLATLVYSIQGGLSAEEILSRTQGSVFWAIFYFLFVASVSIHGAIGLRVIAFEWFGIRRVWLDFLSYAFAFLLFSLGIRAVYNVVFI